MQAFLHFLYGSTLTLSGWYAGAWASTIRWTNDAGGDGKVELDICGGKRGELAGGIGYDAGVPLAGLFGEARVNALALNLALDAAYTRTR